VTGTAFVGTAQVNTLVSCDTIDTDSSGVMSCGTDAGASAGKLVQIVSVNSGGVATTTTLILNDDIIPQNTEGAEFMSLAITPVNTNNTLLITVVAPLSNSAVVPQICALFQDSTASALKAAPMLVSTANNSHALTFHHTMTAGTTSATTFKVRCGPTTASTLTFNGISGARKFGGVNGGYLEILEHE